MLHWTKSSPSLPLFLPPVFLFSPSLTVSSFLIKNSSLSLWYKSLCFLTCSITEIFKFTTLWPGKLKLKFGFEHSFGVQPAFFLEFSLFHQCTSFCFTFNQLYNIHLVAIHILINSMVFCSLYWYLFLLLQRGRRYTKFLDTWDPYWLFGGRGLCFLEFWLLLIGI